MVSISIGLQVIQGFNPASDSACPKTLKNISGSSQEDTAGGKDMLERIGLPREEGSCNSKSCSPRRGNIANR